MERHKKAPGTRLAERKYGGHTPSEALRATCFMCIFCISIFFALRCLLGWQARCPQTGTVNWACARRGVFSSCRHMTQAGAITRTDWIIFDFHRCTISLGHVTCPLVLAVPRWWLFPQLKEWWKTAGQRERPGLYKRRTPQSCVGLTAGSLPGHAQQNNALRRAQYCSPPLPLLAFSVAGRRRRRAGSCGREAAAKFPRQRRQWRKAIFGGVTAGG